VCSSDLESGVAWAPQIPISVSLLVIGLTMAITTVASLLKARRDDRVAHSQSPRQQG